MYVRLLYMFLVFLVSAGSLFSQQENLQLTLRSIDTELVDSIALKTLEQLAALKDLTVKERLEINKRLVMRACSLQQFNKSVAVSYQSVTLSHNNGLDSMEALFYRLWGNVTYFMERKRESIAYFEKCAAICRKKPDYWKLEATCYNNIGGALSDLKQQDSAEAFLLKSIAIMKAHGADNEQATQRSYRVLARVYTLKEQPEKAESLYLHLIENAKENRDTTLWCDNLLYYSDVLRRKGESAKAVETSSLAIGYMKRRHDMFLDMVTGLILHSRNLQKLGNDSMAYRMLMEAHIMAKKSFARSMQKEVGELEVRYKTAQLRQEKELSEVQAKKDKQFYLFLFAGIFILSGVATFIYMVVRNNRQKLAMQRQKLEAVIEGEEKERTRIARDLHDGIVQDLTAIKLKMQGNAAGNELLSNVSSEIDRAAKEVRDIAYQMMPLALKEFGLTRSVDDLLQKMLSPKNIRFEFETIGLDERLPEKTELTLYRITQELLNNVIKHSQADFVSVVISKRAGFISLIFEDNGIGFNPEASKKGIGMDSLNTRLDMVNGTIKFESGEGNGTTAIAKIPLT